MPKRTIYVPDDLNKSMGKLKDANWSAVACAAFEIEVRKHKERKEMGIERSELLERLRTSKKETDSADYDFGVAAGKKWAAKSATYAHLSEFAEVEASFWDIAERTAGTPAESAFGFSGELLRSIDENEWGGRDEQEEFWDHWLNERYPSIEMVRGFVDGATAVWDAVKGEI